MFAFHATTKTCILLRWHISYYLQCTEVRNELKTVATTECYCLNKPSGEQEAGSGGRKHTSSIGASVNQSDAAKNACQFKRDASSSDAKKSMVNLYI